MIRVYNTLSKSKEPFEPVRPGKVGIYLCGPTVYKPSHIGHMVGPVIFDTIKRYLVYNGYDVTLVVNVTDVDDKLIAESSVRKMSMADLAAEMTADYMRNIEALGVDAIDHFPRCTENIDEIIDFTRALVDKGVAYCSDGDVYFDVSKDPEYGKLSHRRAEAMQGEGGGMADRKRNTADFALWKSAKPGEPSWPSPWGKGRPGWHIECSAMSRRLLGPDVRHPRRRPGPRLPPPRKRNRAERMLPRPADGQVLAAQRADAGLRRGGQGRRAEHPPRRRRPRRPAGRQNQQVERLQPLPRAPRKTSRPRRSASSSWPPNIAGRSTTARPGCAKWRRAWKRFIASSSGTSGPSARAIYDLPAAARREEGNFDPGGDPLLIDVAAQRNRFLEAMDDDFNTGGAIGDLFDLLRRLNKFVDDEKLEDPKQAAPEKTASLRRGAAVLRELAATLGLFRHPPAEKAAADDGLAGNLMKLLIDLRAEARKKKDFATADRIRNGLAEIGVTLEDRAGGTEWSRRNKGRRRKDEG